jgi:hypothetical protein
MLDVGDLPEPQQTILLYLMRDQAAADSVALSVLRAQFVAVPNLDAVMAQLVSEGWLSAFIENEEINYQMNYPRKRGAKSNILSNLFD